MSDFIVDTIHKLKFYTYTHIQTGGASNATIREGGVD